MATQQQIVITKSSLGQIKTGGSGDSDDSGFGLEGILVDHKVAAFIVSLVDIQHEKVYHIQVALQMVQILEQVDQSKEAQHVLVQQI